jgi:predicted pyridoxine 5'-phosphate oxidase superfamily flavin-nucleotide-binding protein
MAGDARRIPSANPPEAAVRELKSVDELEAVVGTRPLAMMMKTVHELDEGSRAVLSHAPIAAFGYHDDATGRPRATFVGGAPGFTTVESPTRLTIPMAANEPAVHGGGASLIFFIPGVGETLRVTGFVRDADEAHVTIDVGEAWVHCAKCVLRSKLWEGAEVRTPGAEPPRSPGRCPDGTGPLDDEATRRFLATSTFLVVSSRSAEGASDTSPKGDHAGFVQVLDGSTLAIPDRKGNRRTDTFHNLLDCNEVALAALVPGQVDVLHARGTASVTDDAALLSTMSLGERPPHAALVVRVTDVEITANEALRASAIWDVTARTPPASLPDLMHLGTQQLARNRDPGAKAALLRGLSRGLAASPKVLRRGIDHGYRKELREEGYGDAGT